MGDKVGDKWEISGKTHEAMVEHDFYLDNKETQRE